MQKHINAEMQDANHNNRLQPNYINRNKLAIGYTVIYNPAVFYKPRISRVAYNNIRYASNNSRHVKNLRQRHYTMQISKPIYTVCISK